MARRFTSGTDGVTYPSDTALNITGNITICAWVKVRAQASHSIVNKKQTAALTATPYIFQTANDASPARTQIYRRGSGTALSLLSSVGRITFNIWTHVAVTCTTTQALFYFNAVLRDTVTGAVQTFTTNTQPLFIGDRNDIASTAIDIAHVSIYNTLLTAGEIATVMKFGYVKKGANLIFCTDDNLIADLSGNRRVATLNGATSVVSGPPYIVPYRFKRSAADDYMSAAAGGQGFTLTLNETLGLVDNRINAGQKVTIESVLLADSIAKLSGKNLANVMTLADALTRLPGKTLSEVLALVDTAPKLTGKTLSDALPLADSAAKLTSRTLSDTVILADTIQKVLVIVRTFTETLTLLDSALKWPGKVLPDSLTLVDSQTKLTGKRLTDSLILSDSQTKLLGRVLSESLILADTLQKVLVIVRTLTEALSLADTLTRRPGKELRDSLVLADSRSQRAGKLLSDAVILNDLVSKLTSRSFLDSLTLQDSVLNQFVLQVGFLRMIGSAARMLSELTEDLSRQYSELIGGSLGKPSGLEGSKAEGGYFREAGP